MKGTGEDNKGKERKGLSHEVDKGKLFAPSSLMGYILTTI